MKVVINYPGKYDHYWCEIYGWFSLSYEACDFLGIDHAEVRAWGPDTIFSGQSDHGDVIPPSSLKRNDPKLIECVEILKEKANGSNATLKIVEIPDGIDWGIKCIKGLEIVYEKGHVWW